MRTVKISRENFEQLVGLLRECRCYLRMYNRQISPLSIDATLKRIHKTLSRVGGNAQAWPPPKGAAER